MGVLNNLVSDFFGAIKTNFNKEKMTTKKISKENNKAGEEEEVEGVQQQQNEDDTNADGLCVGTTFLAKSVLEQFETTTSCGDGGYSCNPSSSVLDTVQDSLGACSDRLVFHGRATKETCTPYYEGCSTVKQQAKQIFTVSNKNVNGNKNKEKEATTSAQIVLLEPVTNSMASEEGAVVLSNPVVAVTKATNDVNDDRKNCDKHRLEDGLYEHSHSCPFNDENRQKDRDNDAIDITNNFSNDPPSIAATSASTVSNAKQRDDSPAVHPKNVNTTIDKKKRCPVYRLVTTEIILPQNVHTNIDEKHRPVLRLVTTKSNGDSKQIVYAAKNKNCDKGKRSSSSEKNERKEGKNEDVSKKERKHLAKSASNIQQDVHTNFSIALDATDDTDDKRTETETVDYEEMEGSGRIVSIVPLLSSPLSTRMIIETKDSVISAPMGSRF